MDDLEYRIGKLALSPGDVLVMKLDWVPDGQQVEHLAGQIRQAAGRTVPVLVLTPGIDLDVLTAADIESRAARHGGG